VVLHRPTSAIADSRRCESDDDSRGPAEPGEVAATARGQVVHERAAERVGDIPSLRPQALLSPREPGDDCLRDPLAITAANEVRERAALGREVMALSSQARASASVIIAAPVVFAALGLLSSPGVAAFLFRTPAGLACLVVGLGLDAVAAVWIARLARPSW